MSAYYVQKAGEIFPIYGVTSIEEAREYVAAEDHGRIVETAEDVYMNAATGSVDFESGWDDLSEVVRVEYSAEDERWVEA
ncbi:hypothetical protein ACYCFC_02145 [Stutzerimonas sp. NM35]